MNRAFSKALTDISVKVGSDGSRNIGGAAMDRENNIGQRYNNNNSNGKNFDRLYFNFLCLSVL